MASYHLSVKTVQRSAGRSATAAIAYRTASRVVCEREGRVHDYRAKAGVETSSIVTPEDAPDWARDRQALWNAAEARETRSNSVTARVDAQTEALDRLSKTAAEARQAAFAARSQTDPKLFGTAMSEATRTGLNPTFDTLQRANTALLRGVDLAHTELKNAGKTKMELLKRLMTEYERLRWWRQRLPLLVLGALVLLAMLTLALPRFVALYPTGCWLLGGYWGDILNGCLFEKPQVS
jgi:hypothetical protein